MFGTRRHQVEQRSAHRIFTRFDDRIGAHETIGRKLFCQRVAINTRAWGDLCGQRGDAPWRQGALGNRVDRRDQKLRARRWHTERRQCRQPLGGDAKARGGAVIGQAIPGGQGDDAYFRGEEAGGLGKGTGTAIVGGDKYRAARRGTGGIGHQPRQKAAGAAGTGQRRCGSDEAAKIDHAIPIPLAGKGQESARRNGDIIEFPHCIEHRALECHRRNDRSQRPTHDIDILFIEYRLEPA